MPAKLQAYPDRQNKQNRYQLLTIGRLDQVQKRLDCLVSAFARIAAKHPNWDIVIVGDGPEKFALLKLAKKLGISDRLIIKPSTKEIFTEYANPHLFVLPSRWEGFPNALAEVLSHGLPAVGFSGAQGICDLIVEGETGWLAPGVDDSASLAQALNSAMADSRGRKMRGLKAIEAMQACLSGNQSYGRYCTSVV